MASFQLCCQLKQTNTEKTDVIAKQKQTKKQTSNNNSNNNKYNKYNN